MEDTVPYFGPRRGRRSRTAPILLAACIAIAAGTSAFPADEAEPASPPAVETPLADVRVEGNVTIAPSAISVHVKSRPGKPLDDQTIREDVKALYRTRWFLSVEPVVQQTENGIVLTYRVAERPILRKVEYRGNEKIKVKYLAALTGLKPGQPYDPNTNIEAMHRIEAHYREKGYFFAKVTLLKGTDSNDREVIFDIKEGDKVRVESVKFHGNSFVTGPLLKTKIHTETMWWPLPFRGLYDPMSIQNDMTALKEYYHGLGFFDVKVQEEVSFNEDQSRVTVDYTIAEGVRYQVTEVRYEGNAIFSNEELAEDRELNPGDPFNKRFLQKDLDRIKDKYGATGRLFATIEPVPEWTETPGTTVLVYKIFEDKPYYIRNIYVDIRGDHPHTKPNVARNSLLIHPGDLADPRLIDKSKRRIEGLPAFTPSGPGEGVSIDIKPVSNDEYVSEDPLFRGQSDDSGNPWAVEPTVPSQRATRNPFAGSSDPQQMMPSMNRPGQTAAPAAATTYHPANPFASPGQPSGTHTSGRQTSGQVTTMAAVEPTAVPEMSRPTRTASATAVAAAPPTQPAFPTVSTVPAGGTVYSTAPTFASPQPANMAATSPQPMYQEPTFAVASNGQPAYSPDSTAAASPWQTPPANGTGTAVSGVQTADGYYDTSVPPSQIAQAGAYGGNFGNPSPFIPSDPQGDPLADDPFVPPPGFVDLDIAASEARTGRLMIGAGVNSSSGVVGNIVLSEDNFDITRLPTSWADVANGTAFRGAGQRFRLEAVPGTVVSRYLVSWTDPYFLDTDYSLGVSGFYFQRAYPDWYEQRSGGRVNVGRKLTPFLGIGTVFRGESVEISNPHIPTPPDLAAVLGHNRLLTAGGTLTYDTRDSAMLPSEGQFVELTYTQGIDEFVYPRVDLEGTQFFTVTSRPDGTGKQILSIGGQVGYTGDDTPIFERYYAGGFQSLRGFAFRGVGPRESGVNVGGNFMAVGSVQYMFPLLANDMLQGVVFSDFGTVNREVSLDDVRVAVGGGIRVSIPALGPVPLAFDWAVPLVKEPGDDTQLFSFYVGVTR